MNLSGVRGEARSRFGDLQKARLLAQGTQCVPARGRGRGFVQSQGPGESKPRTSASREIDFPICASESHGLRRVLRKH